MKKKHYEDHFSPRVADLMSALTMIFLFISVTYMLQVNKQKEHIEEMLQSIYNRKIIVSIATGTRFEAPLDRLKDFVSIAYEEGLRELASPCSRTTWEPCLFN